MHRSSDLKHGPNTMDGGTTLDRRPPSTQKISDEEASNWAALLVATIAEPPPLLGVGSTDTGSKEPESAGQMQGDAQDQKRGRERGAASSMASLSESAESHLADTPSVNDTIPRRLVLHVDSETLGRVQLVVDREEGGVRVTVGSDPESRARLSAGKHTLGEALSSAGVRVNALRIVNRSEIGTVLAQDISSQRSSGDSRSKEFTTSEKGSPSLKNDFSKTKNLNLVG